MFIKSINLLNIRNHTSSSYELDDEVIFTGENGCGKTTILESIYFILALRGFKKQPLSNVISFGEKFLKIESTLLSSGYEYNVKLKYNGKRTILIDDVIVDSIYDYMFNNPVSVYSPDFLGVLSISHNDRRSFIDRYIYYTDKYYVDELRTYNRLISQKTIELEKPNFDATYIDILNEKIIELSKSISDKRYKIISYINKSLEKIYSEISFSSKVFLSYKSNINDKDTLQKELRTRRTVYGIQRDRIDMMLDDKLIEKFSSFGQKKTFALLCLLSILKHVEEIRKDAIITLLDDFEAGLDKNRAGVIKELYSVGRQVIYTGVDATRLNYKKIIDL